MIAGPSKTHKKRRVHKELLQSCEEPPQPRPNTMPSCSSHGLNEAASAVARQKAVAGGPVAAMRGEPPEAALEESAAAADLPSPVCSKATTRTRRSRGRNTLSFSLSLPQYHSLFFRAQEFTFSVQRQPPLVRDDTPDDVS